MLEIIGSKQKTIGLVTAEPLAKLEDSFKNSLRERPPTPSREQLSNPLPVAAVCTIFREETTNSGTEMLLVKRQVSDRDPWSGQMAFPGGRSHAMESPSETVVREVMEETRISLSATELQGPLDTVLPGNGSLCVFPFVSFKHEPVVAVTDGIEIMEHYWIPVSYFRDVKNSSTYLVTRDGTTFSMPSFAYLGNVIWGMTLRIIQDVLSRIS